MTTATPALRSDLPAVLRNQYRTLHPALFLGLAVASGALMYSALGSGPTSEHSPVASLLVPFGQLVQCVQKGGERCHEAFRSLVATENHSVVNAQLDQYAKKQPLPY